LRTLGQVDDAIADFRRICLLEPGNAGAWHELIFYLAATEREAEALVALRKCRGGAGETPERGSSLPSPPAAALFDERAVGFFDRANRGPAGQPAYHAQFGLTIPPGYP